MQRLRRFLESVMLTVIFAALVSAFWVVIHHHDQSFSPIGYAQQLMVGKQPIATGAFKQVLFSPDDNIKQALVGLIEAEQKSILVAIYMITEADIAKALIAARKRGVSIELITDPSCVYAKHCKATLLMRNGVVVYVYQPQVVDQDSGQYSSLMHNKFFIFEQTIAGKSVVVTGSYNCTKSATYSNQENMLFLEDADLIAAYRKQFALLKQRSRLF